MTVVDVAGMRLASTYTARNAHFFSGLAALRDPLQPSRTIVFASGGDSNVVHVLELTAGTLQEIQPPIAIPLANDPRYANRGRAFPGWIALSADKRTAYVVNTLGNTVSAIDVASRRMMQTAPVGFFPSVAVVAHHRLFVTDSGLMRYALLGQPAAVPEFTTVPADTQNASALSVVPLNSDGDVDANAVFSRPLAGAPDGVRAIGGADPSALALSRNGQYAYVCLTNADAIAVVDLLGIPRVVAHLDLRLFKNAPYGMQPDAVVSSPDGKRLYVALAGIDAIAVIDARKPTHLRRLGLIPTGWYPSAVALSANGRYLFVTNAKGQAMLQRIDLRKLPLKSTTLSALHYLRVARLPSASSVVPALGSARRSSLIRHVVFILQENKTYDSILGASNAPNLHALASEFGLAANFYADAGDPNSANQYAAGGIATVFHTLVDVSDDPEGYPRAGYVFNSAERAGITYRDYGGLLYLSGYAGGRYSYDVPALQALGDRVDLGYPGRNASIPDTSRAREFIADFSRLETENAVPDFIYIWLPGQEVADSDRAVGTIVDFLTHRPTWNSTAIFVTADGAQSLERTYAVVVSPYAHRGYTSQLHLSTVSILKTEEELLGLPPLSLGDLLASDMAPFFTPSADAAPFSAVP